MKMNMPVMEIIKFDSNDVIATSGNTMASCYEYYFIPGDSDKGTVDTEELFNCDFSMPNGELSSFKSQVKNPEYGRHYDYLDGKWSECNHNHN